ncbi:hypothetical protein TRP8649_01222 [Pelagimonas phthalicica]|uniref:Uncharacterized protein n=1 Tax=Pelagimonas phthalicica TaxID=1037362 RepID=A0A238J8T4_9RHOB|nr:hypothetical protein [Pelagimonas phthalicica]TDS94353.1 hypothetical protein CLV87_0850 [Pelagimonas phthalicica]SMX27120.1 hypothetical protein TRP8649_01222 [Pelagimonas phthalicica]
MQRALLSTVFSTFLLCFGGYALADETYSLHKSELEKAFSICMAWEGDEKQTIAKLSALGFTETSDITIKNDHVFEATHWLTSPNGAATVEIFYGQMAPHCRVSSNTVGASDVVSIIRQHLETNHAGLFREREIGTRVFGEELICPSFIEKDESHPLPFEIFVFPPEDASKCDDSLGAEIVADRLV